MLVTCVHCGTKLILDDAQIAGHSRVKFRCTRCKEAAEFDVSTDVSRTMVSRVKADSAVFIEPTVVTEQRGLALPADKLISLSFVNNISKLPDFAVERPRIIIGRLGADLAVDDPEVSRWHCSLEIKSDEVRLRDLDSRNGVFVGEQRVTDVELQHDSEFRIGGTQLRLKILPK